MNLRKKLEGISYALAGLFVAWREEFNFKFEVSFALAALLLGWYLGLSQSEFVIVIFMIGFVLAAEAFNTALEELCDKFEPTPDVHIKKIKDLAAAAVLISSTTALIVGLIIYTPYILALLQWNS